MYMTKHRNIVEKSLQMYELYVLGWYGTTTNALTRLSVKDSMCLRMHNVTVLWAIALYIAHEMKTIVFTLVYMSV